MTTDCEERLKTFLSARQVVRPSCLSESLGMPEEAVRQWLSQQGEAGNVELLRPIGCMHCNQDHYRMIRTTDHNFLWQQKLHSEWEEQPNPLRFARRTTAMMSLVAILAVAMLTASCVSTQENNRQEGAKAEPGALAGPQIQTTCPVMEGRRINSRLYVDHEGYRIYVCCGPCVKAVRKNPEKYLNKLREQRVAVAKVGQGAATEKEVTEIEIRAGN